jgi:hypothetical protein
MLNQVNERLLRAIVALKTRPEGQVFFEWLAQSRDATLAGLPDVSEDWRLRQEQGQGQLLCSISDTVSKAEKLLTPSR